MSSEQWAVGDGRWAVSYMDMLIEMECGMKCKQCEGSLGKKKETHRSTSPFFSLLYLSYLFERVRDMSDVFVLETLSIFLMYLMVPETIIDFLFNKRISRS